VGGRRCWHVENEAQGTPFPLIAIEQEWFILDSPSQLHLSNGQPLPYLPTY
jgi:hypothetical protein